MLYVHIYLWGSVVLSLLGFGLALGQTNGKLALTNLVGLGLVLPAAIIAGGVN